MRSACTHRRRLQSVGLILLILLTAACGGSGGRVIVVKMLDDGGSYRFEPSQIDVRRGDIVRFEHAGTLPHNVEFVRNSVPAGVNLDGAWISQFLVTRGDAYDVVIDDRFRDGSYDFICSPHAPLGMTARLNVNGTARTVASAALPKSAAAATVTDDASLPLVTGQHGARPAEFSIEAGVKVIRLDVERIRWETKEGKVVQAWAFDRQVPGPTVRVQEGERVRLIVRNLLPEGTSAHWHGVEVPNSMDGVPGSSQDPIAPGDSFTYEFTAKPAGTHLYHSHFNSLHQEEHGLYGMFIVEPKVERIAADREEIMIVGDGPLGFVINGKEFPAITPIDVKKGETVRVRMANLGGLYHPMHLHGGHFTVVAKDGFMLPAPQDMNTLSLAPGEAYDVLLRAEEPGTWLWHCHVLSHVTGPKGPDGMPTVAGMVGVVQVHGDSTPLPDPRAHTTH